MADFLLALLRALHIFGAVGWVGGTFLLAGYHEYILNPGEPEETLERLAEYDRMSNMVGVSSLIAVLAGLALYWIVSGGLNPAWLRSTYGLTITIGAIAALATIPVVIPFVARTNNRAKRMYAEFQETGELTAEQTRTVNRLRRRLKRGERWQAVLLSIAVLAMATAQYL